MEAHRLLGLVSFTILLLLCLYSLKEAPKHWDKMPSLDYVIKNPENFEGKEIYVDGMVRDMKKKGNGVEFLLSPDPFGSFGSISVKSNSLEIKERIQGVNVYGKIANGILNADEIIITKYPVYFDIILNITGLLLFIYFSLKEWKITGRFPFLEVR